MSQIAAEMGNASNAGTTKCLQDYGISNDPDVECYKVSTSICASCGEVNNIIVSVNKTPEKRPHKCPICDGRGINRVGDAFVSWDEKCHACEKGVVWGS